MEALTIQQVFNRVEEMVFENHVPARNANTLRLLAEEMYGMLEGLLNVTELKFDCSVSVDGIFELRLSAAANVTYSAKEQLVEAATSKKNSAEKGIWGKIRGVFEEALCNPEIIVLNRPGGSMGGEFIQLWTMDDYIVTEERKKVASWDGLERSILVNAADDVSVGVRYNKVELIIKKRFS